MIVVDNSVLVAGLVSPESLSAAVRRRLSTERLVAPELIDVETVSALRGLVRAGKLGEEQAARGIATLASLPIKRVSHAPLVGRIWELRHNLTAYDAAYVALAEALEATLVTGDRRLAKASGIRCPVEVIG